MRKLFGKANKAKGAVPEHHCKASGGLIRHILIQLEACGLVEKMDESGGRKISSAVRCKLCTGTGELAHAFSPVSHNCTGSSHMMNDFLIHPSHVSSAQSSQIQHRKATYCRGFSMTGLMRTGYALINMKYRALTVFFLCRANVTWI